MPEPDDRALRVPITQEGVVVDKVAVQTDAVRVHTFADERQLLVEEMVERGVLRIDRIATDRAVDVAPPPRQEGDVTIISLVEERLVVEKRLFVTEEIRVTRERTQEAVAIPVTLRTMRATVERPADSQPHDFRFPGEDA